MNLIFKLLLTINATSWMVAIYIIKEKWTIAPIPFWVFHMGVVLLLILFFMDIVAPLKIVWQREPNNVRGAFTG